MQDRKTRNFNFSHEDDESSIVDLCVLARLEYLNVNNGIVTLTEKARNLLSRCEGLIYKERDSVEIDRSLEKDFEAFWNAFPVSDKCNHFAPSRLIRTNKAKAKIAFKTVMKHYDCQDIIAALKEEVAFRIKNSTKENQLKYLQGPAAWLNSESFLLNISEEDKQELHNDYGKELF